WSVRSAVKTSAPVSAASSSSRSVRLATPTTFQPRERNKRTVAATIPELAPVTTTRRALTSTPQDSRISQTFPPYRGYGGRVTDTGTGQVAARKKRVPVWD